VPSDEFMTDTMNGVKNEWSDTAPGQWIGAVAGVAGQLRDTGSNCAGPALTISDGWVLPSTTLHPFSACSDPQATVASVLRAGLAVVAWVGTFLACVSMLAGALGYRTTVTDPEAVST
jgi:hypothetical protein